MQAIMNKAKSTDTAIQRQGSNEGSNPHTLSSLRSAVKVTDRAVSTNNTQASVNRAQDVLEDRQRST